MSNKKTRGADFLGQLRAPSFRPETPVHATKTTGALAAQAPSQAVGPHSATAESFPSARHWQGGPASWRYPRPLPLWTWFPQPRKLGAANLPTEALDQSPPPSASASNRRLLDPCTPQSPKSPKSYPQAWEPFGLVEGGATMEGEAEKLQEA